jgi:AraC-like DNA-binding protein
MLVSWGARAAYIGPGFELPAHRNAVAVLALALHDPMQVALNPCNPESGFGPCRSVLIEPNQLHLLKAGGGAQAFIYLDSLSHDLAALRTQCIARGNGLNFDLRDESAAIDLLACMPRSADGWADTSKQLAQLLGFVERQNDPRIGKVVQSMLVSPDHLMCAEDWAGSVGLSSSRFQHLFKDSVGVPFRRFRLWARMRIALAHAMRGASLTEAAMAAGMASSAHLSAAFKAMFGIAPSQLVGPRPVFVEA